LWLSYIVDDQHTASSFVVDFAEGFVSFLACSVPEGDFDVLVADLHNFGEELDTHRCFLGFIELIADVSGGDVGFTGTCGADDHDLEHFIVVLHPVINLLTQSSESDTKRPLCLSQDKSQ